MMTPDPKRSGSESLSLSTDPTVVIELDESDGGSIGSENDLGGYAQLPQEAEADLNSDESDTQFDDFTSYRATQPQIDNVRCSTSNPAVQPLTQEQSEAIKSAMANIAPPPAPSWVKFIPEERWMSHLMNQLGQNSSGTLSENNSYPSAIPSDQNFADFSAKFPDS